MYLSILDMYMFINMFMYRVVLRFKIILETNFRLSKLARSDVYIAGWCERVNIIW